LADASAEDFGGLRKMRVAIVHDDLVQWGGAEKVLLGLSEIYPDAPIYTSVYDSGNKQLTEKFGSKKIITSFLQKIPGWKILYKMLLPLYPMVFEQFDFSRYDLVISHTTRFAKCIITKPQTKHICYCHTPPRFLWHFSGVGRFGIGEILLSGLRAYDQLSARRVDHFIAGSENARKRIKKIYGKDSKVIHPFVDLKIYQDIEGFDGGYYLMIGRPKSYKRFEFVKDFCNKRGIQLRVISGGWDDEMVVWILAGCKALIIPGIEDFGLTSLEAQVLGKPVVAFKEGGALETVVPSITGVFFEKYSEDSLQSALIKLNSLKINPKDCRKNAEKFSKDEFIKNFKQAVDSLLYTK